MLPWLPTGGMSVSPDWFASSRRSSEAGALPTPPNESPLPASADDDEIPTTGVDRLRRDLPDFFRRTSRAETRFFGTVTPPTGCADLAVKGPTGALLDAPAACVAAVAAVC